VGLGPIVDTEAFRAASDLVSRDPVGRWAVYDQTGLFADFFKTTGARVFNGTKFIPPLDDLKALDTQSSAASVYNRYAHIGLAATQNAVPTFTLRQPDLYTIAIDPKSNLWPKLGVRYIVLTSPSTDAQFVEKTTLVRAIPQARLWIYEYR
jgi:hypothetical protein